MIVTLCSVPQGIKTIAGDQSPSPVSDPIPPAGKRGRPPASFGSHSPHSSVTVYICVCLFVCSRGLMHLVMPAACLSHPTTPVSANPVTLPNPKTHPGWPSSSQRPRRNRPLPLHLPLLRLNALALFLPSKTRARGPPHPRSPPTPLMTTRMRNWPRRSRQTARRCPQW